MTIQVATVIMANRKSNGIGIGYNGKEHEFHCLTMTRSFGPVIILFIIHYTLPPYQTEKGIEVYLVPWTRHDAFHTHTYSLGKSIRS